MADFFAGKISDKEKEEIKKKAKSIMDDFSKKLSKIDKSVEDSSGLEYKEFEREEGESCESDLDREIMFENAPNKNKDFIIGEKGKW